MTICGLCGQVVEIADRVDDDGDLHKACLVAAIAELPSELREPRQWRDVLDEMSEGAA